MNILPRVKLPGYGADHLPLPTAEEIVDLYVYSPSEPSWPILG